MLVYAGFWRRFAAWWIDRIIIASVLILPLMVFAIFFGAIAGAAAAAKHHPAAKTSVMEQIIPLAQSAHIPVPAAQQVAAPPSTKPVATAPAMPPASAADAPVNSTPATQSVAPMMPHQNAPFPPNAAPFPPQGDAALNAFSGVFMLLGLLFWGLIVIASAFYHTLFISSRWQATPGKRVMGCMVITTDGARLTRWNAFGRHVACIVSWIPWPPICIGFFLAGWTKKSTALHDLIANTYVVRTVPVPPQPMTV